MWTKPCAWRQCKGDGGRTTFHIGGIERAAARRNLVVGCAAFPPGRGKCRVARVVDGFLCRAGPDAGAGRRGTGPGPGPDEDPRPRVAGLGRIATRAIE